MRFEERDVCFAPVFHSRNYAVSAIFMLTVLPALMTLLIPLYLVVTVLTLGRGRPKQEVGCAIKRLWYVATHFGRGNDDATLVI
ncbi:MAG: hypothetical protein CL702_09865 [Chloroflexi bacterium]|nr:hypothetical protein [Chloroflexota bacterium]|tara:strand:+ start:277 stop:528 length:252 start_codon:yes stop_codon:yes gene_type:complete